LKETLSGGNYTQSAIVSSGLKQPNGVAVDGSGNVYIADTYNNRVLKETLSGGSYTQSTIGSGLNTPWDLAVDGNGNVYIADSNNGRILKETLSGGGYTQSTVASGLNGPGGVTVDGSGNVYISDSVNNRILKEVPSGGSYTQSTLLGGLNDPMGIAVDGSGNIYFADTSNNQVLKETLSGGNFGTVTVGSTSPTLTLVFTSDTAGTLGSQAVLTQGTAGLDFADAGTGSCTPGTNYPAGATCTIDVNFTPKFPGSRYGAAILKNGTGNVIATGYVFGAGSGPLVAFGPGIITTVAGNGTASYGGDGGAAVSAQLFLPPSVAMDGTGNLYIADLRNNRIRKVTPGGIISTVAGNGTAGYNGDNIAATSAKLNYPTSVVMDGAGNLYIADFDNSRIRKVTPGGTITTVAGNGTQGYNGDNIAATSAELSPYGLAMDGAGNLYIADGYNNRVRKVTPGGAITTVAGNGTAGYNGDNIAATSAELSDPRGITVDGTGDLYVADFSNHRVRKVASGIITTVAGNGTPGYNGDKGPAGSAELYYPEAVAVDGAGNLYIADAGDDHIRKVTPGGTITTVAGNGNATGGYNSDNIAATSAQLNGPSGVAVDGAGNLYISDTLNNRIRKVDVSDAPLLVFATTNVGAASAAQDVAVMNLGNAPLSLSQISTASNFTLQGPDTTCSSTGQTLNPATSCVLGIEFSPTATGSISGSVVLTDNTLNVSSATQTIALQGGNPVQPRVLTLPAIGVNATAATVKGIIKPSGAAATYWFEYGTRESLTITKTVVGNLPASIPEAVVSAQLTGLTPHTIYYFRAVAQNSAGVIDGQVMEFRSGGQNATSTSTPPSSNDLAASQSEIIPAASASSLLSQVRNAGAKATTGTTVSTQTQTATLEVALGRSMPLVVNLAGTIEGVPMTATCANPPEGVTCSYDDKAQTVTITPSENTPPGSYHVGISVTATPETD
jgi:sugar lactone lactonase YvrE